MRHSQYMRGRASRSKPFRSVLVVDAPSPFGGLLFVIKWHMSYYRFTFHGVPPVVYPFPAEHKLRRLESVSFFFLRIFTIPDDQRGRHGPECSSLER